MTPLGKICRDRFVFVPVLIEDTDNRDVAQLRQQQESLYWNASCSRLQTRKGVCLEALLTQRVGFVLWFSLQQLPVVTSSTIVRCRSCRTYINPFVSFLDQRKWKCNLCYRVNDGKKGGRSDERNVIIWKIYYQWKYWRVFKIIQFSNKMYSISIK